MEIKPQESATYKRDNLAVLRTEWANERTMLAYVRTALSALILAMALLQFSSHKAGVYLGVVALAVGVLFLIIGVATYLRHKNRDITKYI